MAPKLFWSLLLLLLVGRVWYFSTTGPGGLNQDEAAILWNAKLMAQAGRDEWEVAWPVNFRSFGDAKLPGYIYAVAGLGKVIGFSPLTARLPSLLSGVVLAWLVWRIGVEWFKSRSVGLTGALLLALSPWSWHYGTLGFEANFGLTLWLAGFWLVLKRSFLSLLLGAVLLLLAMLTYNSPLLLMPALLAAAALWSWRQPWFKLRLVLIVLATLAAAALTLPATLQKGGISVFADPTYINDYPAYRESFTHPLLQTGLGNKYVYFGSIIWSNWWKHFSWDFLVLYGGGNPWHTIPGTGHWHLVLPILLAIGLGGSLSLTRQAIAGRQWGQVRRELGLLLLFVWSLIPAAITADAPHATRSLFFFVMASIIGGRGLVQVQAAYCGSSLPKRWQDTFTIFIAIMLVSGFALWWWSAPVQWRQNSSSRWNTGLAEALKSQSVQQAAKIYVYDPPGLLYAITAVESEVSPNEFWQSVRRSPPDVAGLVRVESFGKYTFIISRSEAVSPGVLLQPSENKGWDIIEL